MSLRDIHFRIGIALSLHADILPSSTWCHPHVSQKSSHLIRQFFFFFFAVMLNHKCGCDSHGLI
jgi:hypothetical protein